MSDSDTGWPPVLTQLEFAVRDDADSIQQKSVSIKIREGEGVVETERRKMDTDYDLDTADNEGNRVEWKRKIKLPFPKSVREKKLLGIRKEWMEEEMERNTDRERREKILEQMLKDHDEFGRNMREGVFGAFHPPQGKYVLPPPAPYRKRRRAGSRHQKNEGIRT